MRHLLPVLGILLAAAPGVSQEKAKPYPENVAITTTMEAVSAWPEFQRVEPSVPRLEKAAENLFTAIPRGPLPEPKLYGTEVRDPAQRRARELLLTLTPETAGDPNLWRLQPDLPDKVSQEFGISLARGIPDTSSTTGFSYRDPRAGVEFRVRDGVAVPFRLSIMEREPGDWLPKVRDRESWERLASDLYRKAFGEAPFGDKAELWYLHPDQVEFHWRDRWQGLPLPPQYDASVRISEYSPTRKWSLTLERGLNAAAAASLQKGLSKLSFKVTPREAVAIAARNWQAAWPDQSQDVSIEGVSFVLFGTANQGGEFIGGINRCTFYSDPEAAKRLNGGEPLLGMWLLSLHRSGWYDKVLMWVAADTGRVTKVYGAQGLGRK